MPENSVVCLLAVLSGAIVYWLLLVVAFKEPMQWAAQHVVRRAAAALLHKTCRNVL
jgi:hypothetical protein